MYKQKIKEFEQYAMMRIGQFSGPQRLKDAMSYSLFSSGKRVRPLLLFAIGSLDKNHAYQQLFPLALALEMVHTYSLIHDDLPCMDNDNIRRGKPTNHIAFDEATALLAGDALLSQSYEMLTEIENIAASKILAIVTYFAQSIGESGMVGGQVLDIALENVADNKVTLSTLQDIHYLKTGKLLEFAILAPTIIYDYPLSVKTILESFAKNIGILFQAMDDYLDVALEYSTGKTQGIDTINNKITYLSFMDKEQLFTYIQSLEQECLLALQMLALEGYNIIELQKILDLILRKIEREE